MKTTSLLRHYSNLLDKKIKQKWTVHNQTNNNVLLPTINFIDGLTLLLLVKPLQKHTRFILTTMFK